MHRSQPTNTSSFFSVQCYSRRRRIACVLLFAFTTLTTTVRCFQPSTQRPSWSVHYHASTAHDSNNHHDTRRSMVSVTSTWDASAINSFEEQQQPTFSSQQQQPCCILPSKLSQPQQGPVSDSSCLSEEAMQFANRFANVAALRKAFGSNKNMWWGDLDPTATRRLYKTLMPKALMELYKAGGMQPQELAPLAYQARVAAKLYARERCHVPARIAAQLYDGFRQWKKYGKFQINGMTYEQIWEKYRNKILKELQDKEEWNEDDVAKQICLKILEKSCHSNEGVDRMVLKGTPPPSADLSNDEADVARMIDSVETAVRQVLDEESHKERHAQQHHPTSTLTAPKVKTLRILAKARKQLEHVRSPSIHKMDEDSKSKATSFASSSPARQDRPWKNRQRKTDRRPRHWLARQPRQ